MKLNDICFKKVAEGEYFRGGVIPGSRVFFFFGGGGERLSKSRVQGPESRVQSPDSKVQGPVQLLGYAMISITISGIPK